MAFYKVTKKQEGGGSISEEFCSCAKMNFEGIILPFTLNSDYKITVVFYETSYSNDAAVFGNTNGSYYAHLTEYSNKWYTSTGTGEVNFGSWVGNVEHTYIYNNGNGKNEFDGTEVTVNNGYTDQTLKYSIGCRGGINSNLWGGYLKNFKIESISTGDVICELKPYKLSKNGNLLAQGLYDIVNNTLYSTGKIVVSNDY